MKSFLLGIIVALAAMILGGYVFMKLGALPPQLAKEGVEDDPEA